MVVVGFPGVNWKAEIKIELVLLSLPEKSCYSLYNKGRSEQTSRSRS
jgi:hypothetical protein